jgi:hypothetical protein
MEWFDPIPIPDGVYVIRNKATGTVVDLKNGNTDNEAVIWGWFAFPDPVGEGLPRPLIQGFNISKQFYQIFRPIS